MFDFAFFMNSLLLGIGLAMDAFSVSLANGLNEPRMKRRKIFTIAGIFALAQCLMPLIGWLCVHTVAEYFSLFEKLIPYIALALLSFIGFKMLLEGRKCQSEGKCECQSKLGPGSLIVQAIATSIDALSVGFTISDKTAPEALVCALIIAAVTFLICFAGVIIGKTFGTRLSKFASVLGGVILIAIGLEIFIEGVFF